MLVFRHFRNNAGVAFLHPRIEDNMGKHTYSGQIAEMLMGTPAAVVKIERNAKIKVNGNDVYGTKLSSPVRADGCAVAELFIPRDITDVDQAEVTERNLKLDFIKVKFSGLVLEAVGGEFNKLTYRGTIDAVEFLNLTAPTNGPKPEVK